MRSFLHVLWMVLLIQGCGQGETKVSSFWNHPGGWILEEASEWEQYADTLSLVRSGRVPNGIRRPASVATVAGTNHIGSFTMRAEVRSTQDLDVVGRDVVVVFGYQSPTRFYYAHLSNDNTIMPHNGIFIVDGADRRRIDEQWPLAPPKALMDDSKWHDVRLERDVFSGRILLYMDHSRTPLMTATDTTFVHGALGFGSFDDTGMIRSLVWAEGPPPVLDPVPHGPLPPRWNIELEPVIQMPPSDTSGGPMARINYLGGIPDGSGRLFVPDLRGPLHVIKDGASQVYLDARHWFEDFVDGPGLGSGLGFAAFHPAFAENGLFYTVHTEAGRALSTQRPDYGSDEDVIHGVLSEWKATDPGAPVFSGTRRDVLRIGFRSVLHGIQQIAFHPSTTPDDPDHALLYIAVGDGEAPGNQTRGPQSLTTPHGKILRIDPQGTDGPTGQYGFPRGNPFVDHDGVLREIWAMGLRNPHRFDWDEQTGDMFISHIGEAQVDAILKGVPGGNYGWNEWEGGFRYERDDPLRVYPAHESQTDVMAPVLVMDHDDMSALVGGGVYRGHMHEELWGTYIFADLASGRLFEIQADDMVGRESRPHIMGIRTPDDAETDMATLAGRSRAEVRFGKDGHGEIYLLSKANGMIWKLAGARPAFTQHAQRNTP